ncbi:MAG TPA: hypothetical protein VK025_02115, partial [Steroidobacter sp.]|nr:hypothetical protein [Steroidobacter sp.]
MSMGVSSHAVATAVRLAVLVASAGTAHAACMPGGTSHADDITCSGLQVTPLTTGKGDDRVTVTSAAVVNVSAADADVTAAIDVGAGDDRVINEGVVAIARPPSITAASGASGQCHNDNGSRDTRLIGVAGGSGDDHIENRGVVSSSNGVTGAATTNAAHCANGGQSKDIKGHNPDDAVVTASTGIEGGKGDDALNNTGALTVAASDGNGGRALALGMVGDQGDDRLLNDGVTDVSAWASQPNATPAPTLGAVGANASKHPPQDAPPKNGAEATATAVGSSGDSGDDTLENAGEIKVAATATATHDDRRATLIGGADARLDRDVTADATGLSGGEGKDRIENSGATRVAATASAPTTMIDVNLADASHLNANTTVLAHATGVDGGDQDDRIDNTGTLEATAHAASDALAVEVDALDIAQANTVVRVEANATGIDTGKGRDHVENTGAVTATSTATVDDVSVTATYIDLAIVDRETSNLSQHAVAHATGIAADEHSSGLNIVQSAGSTTATATATLDSVLVSAASEGFPLGAPELFSGKSIISADLTASGSAAGIVGSRSGDRVELAGAVSATAIGDAHQTGVTLGVSLLDFYVPSPMFAVLGAGTAADAAATSVALGRGDDVLDSTAHLTANADADSHAQAISVNLAEVSLNVFGAEGPLGAALVAADGSSAATAHALGVDADAGADRIANDGQLDSTATATSGAVSASSNLNLKFGKDEQGHGANYISTNVTLARASSAATANAGGIDAGDGDDRIEQSGELTARATAQTYAVQGTINVAGTLEGRGAAANLSAGETTTTSTATATGLQGGAGDDLLRNTGKSTANATAEVLNISGSLDVGVVNQGLVVDAALARATSRADAAAIALDGGAGRDALENAGALEATSNASVTAVSVGVNIAGTKRGLAAGAAFADARTTATATSIGVASGDEPDQDKHTSSDDAKQKHDHQPPKRQGGIANVGDVSATASASTTAVSVGLDVVIAQQGVALGAALADVSSTVDATASAIAGNDRDDIIENSGALSAQSDATATAVSVSVDVAGTTGGGAVGAALARASVTTTAEATGIAGDAGEDRIANDGDVQVLHGRTHSTGVGVAPNVLIAREGAALGAALADTHAAATTNAAGVDGGDGDDEIVNRGAVKVSSLSADADAVTVTLNVALTQSGLPAGAALSFSETTAEIAGRGVAGGGGDDELRNDGAITLQQFNAGATAVSAAVGLNGGVASVSIGATVADGQANATTHATALDGEAGDDLIANTADINVMQVASHAVAVGGSIQASGANTGVAAGVSLMTTSGAATTEAHALAGGDGDDTLVNQGAIALSDIDALGDAVSGSLLLSGAITGVAGDAALADADVSATSRAIALAGGAGDDALINDGSISLAGVQSDTNAVGVSLGIGLTNTGVALGAALVDTSAAATTEAFGLSGDAGDDVLINRGSIALDDLRAESDAVNVGVSFTAAMTGGVAAGAALVDSDGAATLTAAGIHGGAGDDQLLNAGSILITNARSDSGAVGVTVSAQASLLGAAAGASVADTSATATTTVRGMEGGANDDLLDNRGEIDVQGGARADSTTVGVTVTAALGIGDGFQMTDASSTARSDAAGLDGGAGRDAIVNRAGVASASTATADSGAISVGATIAIGADATLADARSTAASIASGIVDVEPLGDEQPNDAAIHDASKKHDPFDGHVWNEGELTANATASADGASVGGNLFGFALGELAATANANAAGVRMDADRDYVDNSAAICALSTAT